MGNALHPNHGLERYVISKLFFIISIYKKKVVRNLCLTKERDNSNNDSINDWRNFDFNKIKTLNLSNINLSTIENQSYIDFQNLEFINLSKFPKSIND